MSTYTEQTVFIVDDEIPILDSLQKLMKLKGIKVKTFSSAQEFIEFYTADKIGCLLLDVRMPKITGLELHQYIKNNNYSLPVIFISGHADITMVINAIKNGADDFILKPFDIDELLKKVDSALKKNINLLSKKEKKQDISSLFKLLTVREREIMEKVIQGNPSKVIAIDLGISQRTVDIHRANIMHKTQAKSLAHLIKMASTIQ